MGFGIKAIQDIPNGSNIFQVKTDLGLISDSFTSE